jgi:hypothetical protein
MAAKCRIIVANSTGKARSIQVRLGVAELAELTDSFRCCNDGTSNRRPRGTPPASSKPDRACRIRGAQFGLQKPAQSGALNKC